MKLKKKKKTNKCTKTTHKKFSCTKKKKKLKMYKIKICTSNDRFNSNLHKNYKITKLLTFKLTMHNLYVQKK